MPIRGRKPVHDQGFHKVVPLMIVKLNNPHKGPEQTNIFLKTKITTLL